MMQFRDYNWDVAFRWDRRGGHTRTRLLDPYRPMFDITEREAGQVLQECFGCGAFREGVRDTLVEFEGTKTRPPERVPMEVCAACRAKYNLD